MRYNFETSLSWAAMIVFSLYIARTVGVWPCMLLILVTWSSYYPQATHFSEKAQFHVLYGIIWYWFCVQFITGKRIDWVLNVICILTLIHLVMLFSQSVFNFDPFGIAIPARYESVAFDSAPNVGLLTNHNEASIMIAFGAPAFLREKWWVFLPVVLVGLIMPHTFGGVVAVVCGGLVALFLYNISRVWALVGVLWAECAFVLYYFYVDVPDFTWRWKAWTTAIIDLYPEHWLFGTGIGHWKVVFARPDIRHHISGNSELMLQAHNEFVQGLFEMGVMFAVIVICYLISVAIRYNKKAVIPVIALVVIIVESCVYHPFHIALLAMVALTWLAILENRLCEHA